MARVIQEGGKVSPEVKNLLQKPSPPQPCRRWPHALDLTVRFVLFMKEIRKDAEQVENHELIESLKNSEAALFEVEKHLAQAIARMAGFLGRKVPDEVDVGKGQSQASSGERVPGVLREGSDHPVSSGSGRASQAEAGRGESPDKGPTDRGPEKA